MSEQILALTDLHTFDALYSVTARREKFMKSGDMICILCEG